jgi:hypothetical protein
MLVSPDLIVRRRVVIICNAPAVRQTLAFRSHGLFKSPGLKAGA